MRLSSATIQSRLTLRPCRHKQGSTPCLTSHLHLSQLKESVQWMEKKAHRVICSSHLCASWNRLMCPCESSLSSVASAVRKHCCVTHLSSVFSHRKKASNRRPRSCSLQAGQKRQAEIRLRTLSVDCSQRSHCLHYHHKKVTKAKENFRDSHRAVNARSLLWNHLQAPSIWSFHAQSTIQSSRPTLRWWSDQTLWTKTRRDCTSTFMTTCKCKNSNDRSNSGAISIRSSSSSRHTRSHHQSWQGDWNWIRLMLLDLYSREASLNLCKHATHLSIFWRRKVFKKSSRLSTLGTLVRRLRLVDMTMQKMRWWDRTLGLR